MSADGHQGEAAIRNFHRSHPASARRQALASPARASVRRRRRGREAQSPRPVPGRGRRDRRERGGGIQNARGESHRETDKNPRPRHHAGGRGRRAAAAGGAGDSRRQGGEPPDRPPRKRRTQRAGRGAQRTRAPQAQGTAPAAHSRPGASGVHESVPPKRPAPHRRKGPARRAGHAPDGVSVSFPARQSIKCRT